MLNESLDEMEKSAAAVVPLFRKFADAIASDVDHLRQVEAPIDSPLEGPGQAEALGHIRQQVEAFEKALGEIQQTLLNHTKKISLNWLLPGDVDRETAKVEETAKRVPHAV